MNHWKAISLMTILISHYGILDAKVIDIHVTPPGEEQEMERERQRRQDDKDIKTYLDESSSDKDKESSLHRLVKSGGIS